MSAALGYVMVAGLCVTALAFPCVAVSAALGRHGEFALRAAVVCLGVGMGMASIGLVGAVIAQGLS